MRTSRLLFLIFLIVACNADDYVAPGDGGARISLHIGGLDTPDGALVSVDGAAPFSLAAGADTTMDLPTGPHTVELLGLAANCASAGATRRDIQVRRNRTADVAFSATCGTSYGVVEVTVATQGISPDPNGYLVSINGGPPEERIFGAAVARFEPVPAGTHAVFVRDLAPNCSVVGGNPVPGITMAIGGAVRDTVRVDVLVTCTSTLGDLQIITTTSGPPDPDGYTALLGTSPPQQVQLAANDTVTVPNVGLGTYSIALTNLAGNCAVAGTPPTSVTIVGGSTAVVEFTVDCVTPAVLRVSAPTTGQSLDPGYVVHVDNGLSAGLLAGDTVSLDLTPGTHTVTLGDVANNCTVTGPNPATVTLSTAAPTDLVFPVTCVLAPRTGIDFTIVTTGNDQDTDYILNLCPDPYCYYPTQSIAVAANATLQLDVPAGTYYGYLGDVAPNCQYTWTGPMQVTDGQVTPVAINVACAYTGDLAVTVTTTGLDQQSVFYLSVDGIPTHAFSAGAPFIRSFLEGTYSIGLAYVNANCQVTSPHPVTVTLTHGVVTPVSFTVDCVAWPIVHATVTTTGTNLPAGFLVGIDPDPYYGYASSGQVGPNATVSLVVGPGQHAVWLDQVPANCTVTSANPVQVTSAFGETVGVGFAVTCQ